MQHLNIVGAFMLVFMEILRNIVYSQLNVNIRGYLLLYINTAYKAFSHYWYSFVVSNSKLYYRKKYVTICNEEVKN